MNPDPRFFAPDDAARQMTVVGFDHQHEALGNSNRGVDLERGAAFREVADGAVDGSAVAERNLAAFQQPSPRDCSMLVHGMDLRINTEVFDHRSYYPVTVGDGVECNAK